MTRLYQQFRYRLQIVVAIVFTVCFLILFKFFTIQIIDSKNFAEKAIREGFRNQNIAGKRGNIYDRNGNELAHNISRYTIWVNTTVENDPTKISNFMSNYFNKPVQYYQNKLNNRKKYIALENNVLLREPKYVEQQINNIKGLAFDVVQHRHYPYNNLCAQVIGFMNTENIGQVGIEKQFNDILKGQEKNVVYEKSIHGKMTPTFSEEVVLVDGDDISLTIDIDLQSILQEELSKGLNKYKTKSANGILMDPNTGEIIAMATVPDFNPNSYNLFDVEKFQNKVISAEYEPGSTYKIIAISAGLETGVISQDDIFNCENGKYKLSSGKILHDHEPHEDITVFDIFKYSSNIGISKISHNLGSQTIYNYSRQFGFGNSTNLPLPSESSGKLRGVSEWSRLSNTYVPIGQEISATTLQLASSYSVIANGGYLIKPRIISNIKGVNYKNYSPKTEVIRKVVSKETTDELKEMLLSVVETGTGYNARIPGYLIGGKTGTAEKFIDGEYSKNEFISSFASIFPIDNPKYVCVVSVDSPKYGFHWGNESAAPITKEIYKRIIIHDPSIKPSKIIQKEDLIAQNQNENNTPPNLSTRRVIQKQVVPDFICKTLKSAIKEAQNVGLEIKPVGTSGRVTWQSIRAGKQISTKECVLKLETI